MSKFPEPPQPGELARIAPAWRTLPADSLIWRIYFRASRHPTTWRDFRYWGPAGSRLDHHLPDAEGRGQMQDRGIVYAAREIATCVAEVFQATRFFVDRRALARRLPEATRTHTAEAERSLVYAHRP